MKVNFFLIISALIILSIEAFAEPTSRNVVVQPTASNFARLRAVKLKNLGKQCQFQSVEEYLATRQKQNDPELALTTEEFDRSIAFLGDNSETYTAFYDSSFVERAEYCFMTKNELTSLMMYSTSAYHKLNTALRVSDHAMLEQFRIYIKILNSALDKIKNYEGFVKRGAGTNRQRFDDHQVGSVVTYPSYTSTSVGNGFGGVARYVIYSKTCKYIAPFSIATAEEEVLCKPGTQFKVLFREDKKNWINLMMEEVGSTTK